MHLNKSHFRALLRASLGVFAAFVIAASFGCRTLKDKDKTAGTGSDRVNPDDWDDVPITEFGQPLPQDFTQTGTRLTDDQTGHFEHVYFRLDAHNIQSSELQKVRSVAEFLANNRFIYLLVEGHCDERGTTEYNITLGENRALNVRDQLISYGVSPNRIQTVSYGKEKPIDRRHNESAWSKNRRAEFVFYKAP